MDPWVRKGLLVSRSLDHKDHKDHRASLVRRDLRVHKDLRGHRGQRVLQDLKERGETLDSLATPELEAGLGGPGAAEVRDVQVPGGKMELRGLKERWETLDSQAALVHLDRTGSTGLV